MNYKKLVCVLSIIYCINTFNGQITIIDKETKSPIPFTEIYSDSGVFLGSSDRKGIVNSSIIKLIKNKSIQNITLNCISYKNKKVSEEYFLATPKIKLIPKIITLPHVDIKHRSNKEYLKISGYFRSYQINNDQAKYYIDGVMDFYIPFKKKRTKRIINSYRTYVNKKLILEQRRRRFAVAAPYSPSYPILFIGGNAFIKELIGSEAKLIPSKDSTFFTVLQDKERGNILIEPSIPSIQLNYVHRFDTTPSVKKLFGYTIEYRGSYRTEIYGASQLQDIKKSNLLYVKEIGHANYWHKKDIYKDNIKIISEFFITGIEYSNDIKKSKISQYDFFKESNYSYGFWSNVKSDIFQPLPKSVEKALGTTLTELENVYKN